jgi:hypothetical protein
MRLAQIALPGIGIVLIVLAFVVSSPRLSEGLSAAAVLAAIAMIAMWAAPLFADPWDRVKRRRGRQGRRPRRAASAGRYTA